MEREWEESQSQGGTYPQKVRSSTRERHTLTNKALKCEKWIDTLISTSGCLESHMAYEEEVILKQERERGESALCSWNT